MPAWRCTHAQDLAAGGDLHVGSSQSLQSPSFRIYDKLLIGQHRGKLFLFDFHSLGVEVNIPPFLNQITDSNEIVSHKNAFFHRSELRKFLTESRSFCVGVMKCCRVPLCGWPEHVHACNIAS